MKIFVIGSGGREHALVWKLKQAGHEVCCAPGNAGINRIAACPALNVEDVPSLIAHARRERFDLTVVGPEAPLVAGIADEFTRQGLPIFGPNRAAAQLEGSKAFAKALMREWNIPTARFETFTDAGKAIAYAEAQEYPLVIKASGLALGKGAVIVQDQLAARKVIEDMLVRGSFGAAGATVVIEEYLSGEEASIIGVTDGRNIVCFAPSQDHKALLDGDQGPNTGGMGAYAPAPLVTPDLQSAIIQRIFTPLLEGLQSRGIEYRGVIYAGIMVTRKGPYVLEFNCRFGDPETQVILPLYEGDLAELLRAAANGMLLAARIETLQGEGRRAKGEGRKPEFIQEPRTRNQEPRTRRFALCVVAASKGYPGTYEKGKPISGRLAASSLDDGEDVIVFHAGTKLQDGQLVTAGGRVLGVTALGDTLVSARHRAYAALKDIHFEGMQYRSDIGAKGMTRTDSPPRHQDTKKSFDI